MAKLSSSRIYGNLIVDNKVTVNGELKLNETLTIDTGDTSADALVIKGSAPTISFIDEGTSDDFYLHVNDNNFYILRDKEGADLVGTGYDTEHPLRLEGDTDIGYLFGSRMFAENYHPNADKLTTARSINGTNFNGTANITTANWGTARTLTIGNTGKSVNGSGNVSWSLAEIGALSTSGKAADADKLDGINSSQFLRSDTTDTMSGRLEMGNVLDMNNYDIYGVDQIFHHGDTNTYIQFHASDQFRVVTGGAERLEVNNAQTKVNGYLNTGQNNFKIWTGKTSEYDLLSVKDANTLYFLADITFEIKIDSPGATVTVPSDFLNPASSNDILFEVSINGVDWEQVTGPNLMLDGDWQVTGWYGSTYPNYIELESQTSGCYFGIERNVGFYNDLCGDEPTIWFRGRIL